MVSKYTAALAAALLAGSALAGPVAVRTTDIMKRTPSPLTYHAAKQWDHQTLFAGSYPAIGLNAGALVDIDITLPKAAINGDITIGATDDFLLHPTIAIDVSGLEAHIELDLHASAAVHESLELMASAKLGLQVPGLLGVGIDAGIALDLVIGVTAAIDVEAGIHLVFPSHSVIEVSLLNQQIVGGDLSGIVAKILPIGLGVDVDLDAEIELTIGLRARVVAAVGAGLNIVGLDVGAGAEVVVWINLFSYTQVLVSTPKCTLSIVESLCLDVGVAVDLDVEVADIVDISLAPTVSVTLAVIAAVGDCKPTIPPCARCGGHGGQGDYPGSPDYPGLPSPTGGAGHPGTSSPVGVPTSTHSPSAPGLPGVPTGGLPTGGAGYPTTSSSSHVHPTGVPTGGLPTGGVTTTTAYETITYTITQCAVTVPNCPASHTQVVITSTTSTIITVVPTGGDHGAVPTSAALPETVTMPSPTATRTVTLTSSPAETNTFTPPANLPSVPPTYIVPDTPAAPTGGSAEVPGAGDVPSHPDTPASPVNPGGHLVPVAPCVGCVGPATGVSTSSYGSATATPVSPIGGGGDYPTIPGEPGSSSPVPIPTGAASRAASGAAGFLAVVAGFALL